MYDIFNKDIIHHNKQYDLHIDGCCKFQNVLSNDEINILKKECENNNYEYVKKYLINHTKINNILTDKLGSDYQFQDYIFIIRQSSIHTCHRDNNGNFFNEGQKHPSYTMIIYIEDMEKCLGVIPNSHMDKNSFNVNFTNKVENMICNKGDIILFNANLIHVGTINDNKNNLRIQMKVSHKEDIPVLSYFQNYNKILNQPNNVPTGIIKFQKNLSCMFPYLSNLTQKEIIKSSGGSDNGAKISIFQKIFSYLFYGNSNFYDLPNAF